MSLEIAFALIGGIIFLGLIGALTFDYTGLPEPLILILLGLLIGPVLEWVPISLLEPAAPYFGTLALVLILFEGGMSLDIRRIAKGFKEAVLLMVGSFTVTTLLLAFVAHHALELDWMTSTLFATIFAGAPSGVIVIPLVARMKVPERVRTIVNLESSFSDVVCVVLTVMLMGMLLPEASRPQGPTAVVALVHAFLLAGAVGFPTGALWVWLLEKKLKHHHLSYVMTLGVLMVLYSCTGLIGGSGAIAALCFGISLGNAPPILGRLGWWDDKSSFTWRLGVASGEGEKVRTMHMEVSFLVRTFFFVYLGIVANLAYRGEMYLLTVGGFMAAIFLARYGSLRVFELLFPREEGYREVYLALIPRGLAAAVLAGMPAAKGIPGTAIFVELAFALILITNLYTAAGCFFLRRKQKPGVKLDKLGAKPSLLGRRRHLY